MWKSYGSLYDLSLQVYAAREKQKEKMIRAKEKHLQRFPAEPRASIPSLLSLSTPPPFLHSDPHLRPGTRYELLSVALLCFQGKIAEASPKSRLKSLSDATD